MNTNVMNMPGYRYFEYQLVLLPHQDLRNKIVQVKKNFHRAYNIPAALGGKPHILLAKFTVWEMMEEKILNRLKLTAMGMPPFKVHLKDYGSFPSHTIFINVTTKLPVQHLVKEIRTAKRLMKSPDYEPFFITDPHITIARKLTPDRYQQGWQYYAHKSFTGSFIADGMLLLKRREGEKAYQIVQRLDFLNLPITTTQGDLFA